MSQSDIPILVVDDARFSTTIITRNLKSGGYTNISHVDSARQAIALQENTPASIIIADWLMPEMDGLELTKRIRQMDEAQNRYTYVIMLTARDGIEALKHAFDEGVDDFVNKSVMQQQLLPRVYAAERLVNNQNRLLRDAEELLFANRELEQANEALEGLCTLDSLTGLGNRHYALNKLQDNLLHTESRGGATCFMLIKLSNADEIQTKYPADIIDELMVGVSRRLKGLLRPLDDVSRIDQFSFSVVTHQPDLSMCIGQSFRRIKDSINHRAFQTSMGFQSINVDMSIAAASNQTTLPKAEVLIEMAEQRLIDSAKTSRIEHVHYTP